MVVRLTGTVACVERLLMPSAVLGLPPLKLPIVLAFKLMVGLNKVVPADP